MGKRKEVTPEAAARKEMIRTFLRDSDVSSMEDVMSLFKEAVAEFLNTGLREELTDYLGYGRYDYVNKQTGNSRNGSTSKKLRTSMGEIEIETPRDRNGEFEPQLIKKNQTSISPELESKVILMYAKGMSDADISDNIRDMYGTEVSESTISRITDAVLPRMREWQQRPLENVYAVVFMDAVHFNVRSEGCIVKKAVYIAIGINLEGKKDVLGMWIGENESARYWLTVMNNMKNRGVEDILIMCTDNLTGLTESIAAAFPRTEVQHCIIHQIRATTKYVSYKDLKALVADLKKIYAAADETSALDALDDFSEKWKDKYPQIARSWRANWPELSPYFKYPEEIRRLIYTTNQIEGFNRQMRKVTKTKSVFPTDDSLLKILYLAMMDVTKKWTAARHDWKVIRAQLSIFFGDRIPE